MAPRLLGVAAVQLNFVINTMVAASLGQGSLSAIKVAFMLMTMPLFAIAQSVATAALPTFSAQVARGEIDEMRAALASTLRGILLLSIPATVGLILLRQPIVAMLFERGAFDATSTELTAWALLWYTAGLVGHAVVEILSRAFYALHDTKTPVMVGTAAMVLNALFSFIFPGIFSSIGWLPLGGLALANSLATALEALILLLLIGRRLQGLNGADVAKGAVQFTAAALGMALGLLLWIKVAGELNPWLIGLGGVAAGGLVYGLGVFILKVPEIHSVIGFLKRKIGLSN
jgi:putative peptidoglycan lipid II flippase